MAGVLGPSLDPLLNDSEMEVEVIGSSTIVTSGQSMGEMLHDQSETVEMRATDSKILADVQAMHAFLASTTRWMSGLTPSHISGER